MSKPNPFFDKAEMAEKIAVARRARDEADAKMPLSLRTMDQIASMWDDAPRAEYDKLKPQLRVALYARALKGLEWSAAYQIIIKDAPMPDVFPENPDLFSDGIAVLRMMANGNAAFQYLLQYVKGAELHETMLLAEPLALENLKLQMREGSDRAAANILKYATDLRRSQGGKTKPDQAAVVTTNNVVMVSADKDGIMRIEPPKPKMIQAEVLDTKKPTRG